MKSHGTWVGFHPCPCWLLALDMYLHGFVPRLVSVYHNAYRRGLLCGQKVIAGKDSEHSKCTVNANCSHLDLEGFEDPCECTQ